MKSANGFVSSGIRWDVIAKVHPQITLKEQIACEYADAPLAKIDAALAAGQPVVVRVDSSPAPGLQWHYVMVYARKGNDYLMLDPYPYSPGTVKEDLLMARYSRGNPLQRSIQQVLLYQCSTAGGGAISTPASSTPTTSTPTDSGPHARVMAEVTWGLNIRSSTDTSSMANVVANAAAGTELLLTESNADSKIGVNGQWVRVRTPQGQEGLAAAWYLEKIAAANPPVVPAPASNPVNDAPASSTPAAPPASSPVNNTPASPSSTPPPAPQKFQVIIKAAGTPIYNGAAASASVMTTEKAGARLTVVEAMDTAKAKVGVKGQRINIKASNNQRGFVDGDKVRLA
jgi:hypothetical protein